MKSTLRVVKILSWIFQILFWLVPITAILFWAVTPASMIASSIEAPRHFITVDSTTRLLGGLVNLVPTAVIMYSLSLLIRLFANYQAQKIFTPENTVIYRRLSFLLFAWVFLSYLYNALLSFIFTYHAPYKIVSVIFKTSDIKTLVAAGVCIVIANVVQEGHKLAVEQELTI